MKNFRVKAFSQIFKQVCLGVGGAAIAQLSIFTNPSFAEANNVTLGVYAMDVRGKSPICPNKYNGEPFEGHSYLRMRFVNDKVYLILDMTGLSDANGLMPVILNKGVKDGNPTWTWGGTD